MQTADTIKSALRHAVALLFCLFLAACGQTPPTAPVVETSPTATQPAPTTAAPIPTAVVENTATPVATDTPQPTPEPTIEPTMNNLIPKPATIETGQGAFTLTGDTAIYLDPPTDELQAIGRYLAERLGAATGYEMRALPPEGTAPPGSITLTTAGADEALGEEGYELTVSPASLTLSALRPAGLFRGVQTIRQLLPAAIESAEAQPGPWPIPAVTISDFPRYEWRGVMLDVARHFFSVEDVKRYIDLAAYYKLNRFHLHLSDDQGWRIEIKSWPELTGIGASTGVGGSDGGFYTQEEYADIVAYATGRYITIVPEIDIPGHTNAALASYPELNCDGVAPEPYTGVNVGFSSLCVDKEITYEFLDDVIRELAAITPGPYLHIGGDEAMATEKDDYLTFMERVRAIVQAHDKTMVGWEEIGQAPLAAGTLAQHWGGTLAVDAAGQGAQIIMSPASRAYLDMKYDGSTELGQDWAGTTNVEDAYTWDPATILPGVAAGAVIGVEAPIWTETMATFDEIEYMVFPRLPGIAEIGWSPADGREWDEYKLRLAAHGPRLESMGVDFFRSPEVPWD